LLGSGSDLTLNSDEFEQIWAFDNITKAWIENIGIIKRGYGFWVKYSSELTKIYNSESYLNIQKGWNLIANPTNQELDIAKSLRYATETYKYKNNEWLKNEAKLSPNEGIWVNYSAHVSEKIDGNGYENNFTNLNNGWNLFGSGKDINLSELSQFSQVLAYDSKLKKWFKNPTTIYRGYGFWVK
jgi:hypothetical protein